MVAHRHAPTTATANNHSLQQGGGAFARRTLATIGSHGLCVLQQSLLVLFVFLPADISRMGTGKKRVPLISWDALQDRVAVDRFPRAAPAIDERSRIAWVMEDTQYLVMLQLTPEHISPVRPAMKMARKQ